MFREFFAMILEEAVKGLKAKNALEAEELMRGIGGLVVTAMRHMEGDEIPEEMLVI